MPSQTKNSSIFLIKVSKESLTQCFVVTRYPRCICISYTSSGHFGYRTTIICLLRILLKHERFHEALFQ